MKHSFRFCVLLLTFALCFPYHFSYAATPSAKAYAVMEAESGKVLLEKAGDLRLPMASTTKIMTALVVLEKCKDLNKTVKIPKEAVGTEGSSLYLKEGERFTLSDLLYGLLLRSANDAAVALALTVSPTIAAFAEEMNRKAEALGMSNSHFENPHGLDAETHYTTAKDLALLAAAAMQDPRFSQIVGCQHKRIPSQGENVRSVSNHNKLLRLSDAAVGVKTGFTKKSGRCLVGAFEGNGVLLITVTLDAPDDWNDHLLLYTAALPKICRRTPFDVGEYAVTLPVVGGKKAEVHAANLEPVSLILSPEEALQIQAEYNLFAVAPIKKGQVLGTVTVKTEAQCIEAELCAIEDVPLQKTRRSLFRKNQ